MWGLQWLQNVVSLHLLELAHSYCTNSTKHLWSVQEGEAAAISLLAMVQRTVEQMDAATAAQHADACYSFLLQALDTRQRKPACLASIEGVEEASVAVLLALTMKLSEAKFKPLFLRLLDWASTAPAAQPGESACIACRLAVGQSVVCLHLMFAVRHLMLTVGNFVYWPQALCSCSVEPCIRRFSCKALEPLVSC